MECGTMTVVGIALKRPRSKVPIVYIIVAFETEQQNGRIKETAMMMTMVGDGVGSGDDDQQLAEYEK